MEIRRGIAVSPGVAIGPAFLLDTEWFRIPHRHISHLQIQSEQQRFRRGLEMTVKSLRESEENVRSRMGEQYAAIFAAHVQLALDPNLANEIENEIRENRYSAEYAVSRVMRRYAKTLEALEDPALTSHTADVFDIEKRLLRTLLGQRREQLRQLSESVVVLAQDLSPSETASLDGESVLAFATEAGGRTSHTAIVAGVLAIPAVVGAGRFMTDVSGGDTVIIDGNDGLVILDPDEETLARYEQNRKSFLAVESKLADLRDKPAQTQDNTEIRLYSNIEFPHETELVLLRGASGIGLYRTEFLFMDRLDAIGEVEQRRIYEGTSREQIGPEEEEQLQAYRTVIDAMGTTRPIVIRTMDLGADKFLGTLDDAPFERNPFLGSRSIRLCLRNLTLFKTQLRAILRASAFGDVRIMFPMITTLLEIRQCKMLLNEVKEDLDDEGIEFNSQIRVGTMIEVPAAAILAEQLAKEVDFFSIGTNDLVQYTLAADRNNKTVASLYSAGDPAVLRLLKQVIHAAQQAQIDVTICGEMSGDTLYTMLLLGLGIRQLSATPHAIPEVKRLIRSVRIDECKRIAHETMRLETARDVNTYLREQTRRIVLEGVG